ncbi:transposase [Bacillus cereus]|uniref:transposase n=1 Tax=Bacillus cereus TaxID=1396 RepID=UPI0009534F5E|nr:transposase [Bacillus cereus]OLR27693.1 hypothetical protein BLD50_00250 [Bacillus cereus]
MIDQHKVTKVCIDDFAIKKGQRYGTIMVDIETHKIIDLIPPPDLEDVMAWLKTFPKLLDYVKQAFQRLLPNLIKVSHHLSGSQMHTAYQFLTVQKNLHLRKNLKR